MYFGGVFAPLTKTYLPSEYFYVRFFEVTVLLFAIKSTAIAILSLVQLAMAVRAVLSWFPMDQNKFTEILDMITEPFIMPIRALFVKMNWFQQLPLDMSFLASYLLITAVIFLLG